MNHIKLFESYATIKALEELTKALMERVAQYCVARKTKVHRLPVAMLRNVNSHEFTLLTEFINDFSEMGVELVEDERFEEIGQSSSTKASYMRAFDMFGEVSHRDIFVRIRFDTLERVNSYIDKYIENEMDERMSKAFISSYLFDMFGSSIMHEMQHAYDDWRSAGKALKHKKHAEMLPKAVEIGRKKPADLEEEEIAFITKFSKVYLNQQHEVDARFTQAMLKMKLCEFDFDTSMDKHFYFYNIMPFDKALKKFKREMNNYQVLTAKEQKRILQKFGQFYEMEKTFVADKNAEKKPFM